MEFTVGAIVEGKVKSITNFGAFISLPEGRTGMVHISEIAHAYVSDIRQHLTEGQDVKVMILAAENGKINLSIKRTVAQPERTERPQQPRRNFEKREPRPAAPQQQNNFRRPESRPERQDRPAQPEQFVRAYTPAPSKDQSFEDKLKQFMTASEGKMADLNRSIDGKRGGGRRRR